MICLLCDCCFEVEPPVVDLGVVEEWCRREGAAYPESHYDPAQPLFKVTTFLHKIQIIQLSSNLSFIIKLIQIFDLLQVHRTIILLTIINLAVLLRPDIV